MQNLIRTNHAAITYDQACVGPCVGSLQCDHRHGSSHTPALGCRGPTGGDYRHPLSVKRVEFDLFEEESIVRLHGNFSLSPSHVLVGNGTKNMTVPVSEHIYDGDVTVTFGSIYDCIIIRRDVSICACVRMHARILSAHTRVRCTCVLWDSV